MKVREDANLSGRTQHEALGIGNQRTEVGHGTHAHEDEAGIDTELDAQVEVVEQSGLRHEVLPVYMTARKERRVVHVGIGEVRQQHAEGDGQQQQRLEFTVMLRS